MAATQRLRQGVRALLASTRPVEYALAGEYLNTQQMAFFQQMTRSEQLHSLNVLRAILAQGSTPDDLAVAALLHDVGKSRYPLAIWQKSTVVLVRHFLPQSYTHWSNSDGRWQQMFVLAEKHPQWSAEIIQPTGATERALWLIAHHADELTQWQNHPYVTLLERLKLADDTN